jgi:hypothetical protein
LKRVEKKRSTLKLQNYICNIYHLYVTNSYLNQDEFLLKGIVSRDFGVLFLIYLDRYDVPNRAGSGLFLILKRSSYLNF